MLTLQELKEEIEIPVQKSKMPTAKKLKETGVAVAEKQLKNGTRITAYQNGYALYHICGHDTVFSIHTCGDYLYESNGTNSYLPDRFFEKEPWYIRLVLEGEDRINHNQCAKEQEWTVSYSAVSEDWEMMGDTGENPLDGLVDNENRKEMLRCLTDRQRKAVCLCIFQQKTGKEAARELGISTQAVSAILLQAVRRMQKQYLSGHPIERAAAV